MRVEVVYQDETVWLTQKSLAELFGVKIPAVNKHLPNIYSDGELQKEGTISILEIVQNEGERSVKRKVELYNLDAIIAVGYRVKSLRGVQFRRWATTVLRPLVFGIMVNVVSVQETKYGNDDSRISENTNRHVAG